jgi:hypothetical protein
MANLDWRGDKISADIKEVLSTALYGGGEIVRAEAVQRAPKDRGTLRLSAKTTVDGNKAAVSFNTKYAARQHEEVGYHHSEGEAKYLENAVTAKRQDFLNHVTEQVRKAL